MRVAAPVSSPVCDLLASVAQDLEEHDADLVSTDPLGWPGYADSLERARERSGTGESVRCCTGRIGGVPVAIVALDFSFMGGSLGEAVGRRIVRAIDRAVAARMPVVSLLASGGCRMQEGMHALVQMQAISAAWQRAARARVPHIATLVGPTTGGAWASIAAGADVLLAVPGAAAAFAGHRVRSDGAGAHADATCATGKLRDGQIDAIVQRADLPAALADLVTLLAPGPGAPDDLPAPAEVPAALGAAAPEEDGWAAVLRTRDPARPRAAAYLDAHFERRVALSGDRAGGVDAGMLCGIGLRDGATVAYVAQTGTANTAAGFRTAARVVRLADRLRLPVLTLIDTPGAANDADAEHQGIGPAIAEVFAAVAGAGVPITTLVIGEGGSGGALALGSHTDLWVTPDAYFTIIAPEAAAAILKLPATDVPAVARRMRLRPQDLVELGIARGIAVRR